MSKPKAKTNKRTNKIFIRVIAGMLCAVIVCLATNKVFDALSSSVADTGAQNNQPYSDNSNNQYVPNGDTGNVQGDNGVVADNGQQVQTPDTPAVVPNSNGNTQGNQQVTPSGNNSSTPTGGANSTDPTTFNKAQLVNYYNQCLRNTYSQPKFTVTKTEKINVQLGEMYLNGKPATNLQGMANKVVASNAAKGGTKSANFTNKTAVVDAKERFILPTNLTSAGVQSCNVKKSGSGYVINITLVSESCDFTTKPPYNRACTFPLDFTEIDLGGIGQITSAQFYYPGTKLTANVDGNGRVTKTFVYMPLSVKDAKGKGMGQELQMDISGSWECTNIFKF